MSTWCINTSYIPLTEQHELEEWMLFCLVTVTYMSPLATHCHHPLTLSLIQHCAIQVQRFDCKATSNN